MTPRDVALGACLAVGGCAGMFAAFWSFFVATEDPMSWLARAVRLRS